MGGQILFLVSLTAALSVADIHISQIAASPRSRRPFVQQWLDSLLPGLLIQEGCHSVFDRFMSNVLAFRRDMYIKTIMFTRANSVCAFQECWALGWRMSFVFVTCRSGVGRLIVDCVIDHGLGPIVLPLCHAGMKDTAPVDKPFVWHQKVVSRVGDAVSFDSYVRELQAQGLTRWVWCFGVILPCLCVCGRPYVQIGSAWDVMQSGSKCMPRLPRGYTKSFKRSLPL